MSDKLFVSFVFGLEESPGFGGVVIEYKSPLTKMADINTLTTLIKRQYAIDYGIQLNNIAVINWKRMEV